MRYDLLHEKIKTGDVFTTKGDWIFSRLIRFATKQPVSHTGMFVWLQFNGSPRRLCIIEALEGVGVRLVPARFTLEKDYWNHSSTMYWQQVIDPKINGNELASFVLDHWTDDYASKYQFVVGISRFVRTVRWFLGKSLDTDARRWHCSELITRAFMDQGYKHEKEPSLTTPGDVSLFNCLAPRVEIEPPKRDW